MPEIILVRPAKILSLKTFSSPSVPPLGLASLASNLEKHNISYSLIDALGEGLDQLQEETKERWKRLGLNDEEIIKRIPKDTKIIGISCMFSTEWPYYKRLVSKIRITFPHSTIIVGGEHVTALPEITLEESPEIDIVSIGESEETIVEIVQGNDLNQIPGIAFRKDGTFFKTAKRKRIADLENLPRPQWDAIPLTKYWNHEFKWSPSSKIIRSLNILASRGCPYCCTFCSGPQMWGTQYISRSPEDVIDELTHLKSKYNINHFDFCDLTATINSEWIIRFSVLLQEKLPTLSWSLPIGTRTDFYKADVLKALQQSSCTYFSFCPESGSKRMLKILKKKVDLDQMFRSLKMAKKLNLTFKCNFILGFPEETRSDILRTLLFCFKTAWAGAADTIIFPFSPYPGSEEFNNLLQQGIVDPRSSKYYHQLMNIMDLSINRSFSKYVSTFELSIYRIFGMSMFYCLKFIRRPQTFFHMIRAILFTKESNCLLEQRIIDMIKDRKTGRNIK